MPTRNDYANVALELKSELDNHMVHTVSRQEITDALRRLSGEPNTRLRRLSAQELTVRLLEQGVSCWPNLADSGPKDNIRLFPNNSAISHIINLIVHPSTDGDKELEAAFSKVSTKAAAPPAAPARRGRPRKVPATI